MFVGVNKSPRANYRYKSLSRIHLIEKTIEIAQFPPIYTAWKLSSTSFLTITNNSLVTSSIILKMAPNPQRIIELQKRYQNSNQKLWLRGPKSKLVVYPFYALFTVSTAIPLFYAGRGILGIKPE